MTDALSEETVTVRVEWHERAKYATTIEMSRADYERLRTKWVEDTDEVEAVESEVITRFSLTRVEAHDWDDLEFDTFVEADDE